MLRTIVSAMLIFATPAPSATAQGKAPDKSNDPKKGIGDQIKWETKDFETAIQTEFGLKMKSVSLLPAESKGGISEPERVKFLLEFDKDAEYEVKKLNASFNALRVAIDYGKKAFGMVGLGGGQLELLIFDQENVIIGKLSRASSLDGEITGKKGEAFRVYVRVENSKVFAKANKIEVRLYPRVNVQPDKLSTEASKAIKWDTADIQKTLESDFGIKMKSVSIVKIDKTRHIMLACERTKKKNVQEEGKHLFNLAGLFDPPFKSGSGGIECTFFAAGDTLLETIKASPDVMACCIDDDHHGFGAVGEPITIFMRAPGEAVLEKTTRVSLKVAPPEKLKDSR